MNKNDNKSSKINRLTTTYRIKKLIGSGKKNEHLVFFLRFRRKAYSKLVSKYNQTYMFYLVKSYIKIDLSSGLVPKYYDYYTIDKLIKRSPGKYRLAAVLKDETICKPFIEYFPGKEVYSKLDGKSLLQCLTSMGDKFIPNLFPYEYLLKVVLHYYYLDKMLYHQNRILRENNVILFLSFIYDKNENNRSIFDKDIRGGENNLDEFNLEDELGESDDERIGLFDQKKKEKQEEKKEEKQEEKKTQIIFLNQNNYSKKENPTKEIEELIEKIKEEEKIANEIIKRNAEKEKILNDCSKDKPKEEHNEKENWDEYFDLNKQEDFVSYNKKNLTRKMNTHTNINHRKFKLDSDQNEIQTIKELDNELDNENEKKNNENKFRSCSSFVLKKKEKSLEKIKKNNLHETLTGIISENVTKVINFGQTYGFTTFRKMIQKRGKLKEKRFGTLTKRKNYISTTTVCTFPTFKNDLIKKKIQKYKKNSVYRDEPLSLVINYQTTSLLRKTTKTLNTEENKQLKSLTFDKALTCPNIYLKNGYYAYKKKSYQI